MFAEERASEQNTLSHVDAAVMPSECRHLALCLHVPQSHSVVARCRQDLAVARGSHPGGVEDRVRVRAPSVVVVIVMAVHWRTIFVHGAAIVCSVGKLARVSCVQQRYEPILAHCSEAMPAEGTRAEPQREQGLMGRQCVHIRSWICQSMESASR